MTHGCSLFSLTHRNLTALDIVTAHSTVPGREDVALLLEEAMRGEGWTGGRMETRRRLLEERSRIRRNQRIVRDDIGKALGVNPGWWDGADSDASSSESELEQEDDSNEKIYVGLLHIFNGFSLNLSQDTPRRLFVYACLCSSITSADI
jgi:hypothetical protein